MSAADRRFLACLAVGYSAAAVPSVWLLVTRPPLGFVVVIGEFLIGALLVGARIDTTPHEAADVQAPQNPAPCIPRRGAGQAAPPTPVTAGQPSSFRPDPIEQAAVGSVDDTLGWAEVVEILSGGAS